MKKKRMGRAAAKKESSSDLVSGNKGCSPSPVRSEAIKGVDDTGRFYDSQDQLVEMQELHRDEFYDANDRYWANGGYGGLTDDEAMIGDTGGEADGEEGLAFLDRLLERQRVAAQSSNNIKSKRRDTNTTVAIDLGAGVGRVTKMILLKRYDEIRLVEGNEAYSKRSKLYLGRKRANRCIFTNCLLQDITPDQVMEWGQSADLMWLQWTLQYLTDDDAIDCLRILSGGLIEDRGVLVVKENRPYGNAREDRFQMDTPGGENKRYDITRPDAHHRLIFHRAGLRIEHVEEGVETNTYALMQK